MKKIVLILATMAACFSASAALEDRLWTSLFNIAPLQGIPEETGDFSYGVGWYTEVFNITDNGGLAFSAPADVTSLYSTELSDIVGGPGVSPVLGEGGGYYINDGTFGQATDLDNVQLVLYNNANKALATSYITSLAYALPDAPEIAGPGDTDVTFDFTGQTWQAIPEPATVLLFGIGGMGAWLLRRRQQA